MATLLPLTLIPTCTKRASEILIFPFPSQIHNTTGSKTMVSSSRTSPLLLLLLLALCAFASSFYTAPARAAASAASLLPFHRQYQQRQHKSILARLSTTRGGVAGKVGWYKGEEGRREGVWEDRRGEEVRSGKRRRESRKSDYPSLLETSWQPLVNIIVMPRFHCGLVKSTL